MENKNNVYVNVKHGNDLYSLETEKGDLFSGDYDLDVAKKDLEQKFFKIFPFENPQEINFVYRPTIFDSDHDVNNIEVNMGSEEKEMPGSEQKYEPERSPGDKLLNAKEISTAFTEELPKFTNMVIELYNYIDGLPLIGENTARWKAMAKTALEQAHDSGSKAISIVR